MPDEFYTAYVFSFGMNVNFCKYDSLLYNYFRCNFHLFWVILHLSFQPLPYFAYLWYLFNTTEASINLLILTFTFIFCRCSTIDYTQIPIFSSKVRVLIFKTRYSPIKRRDMAPNCPRQVFCHHFWLHSELWTWKPIASFIFLFSFCFYFFSLIFRVNCVRITCWCGASATRRF